MKKFVLAVAIAMAGAWGIYQANQNNNLSELQMENVELLAQGEPMSTKVEIMEPGKYVPCVCYGTGNIDCCN